MPRFNEETVQGRGTTPEAVSTSFRDYNGEKGEGINREGIGKHASEPSPVPAPAALSSQPRAFDPMPQAEADRVALMRADREPPFHSREALVRVMATTYPADMLDRTVRRAAARDPNLEWRVGKGCYGYRRARLAAPVPESRASPMQYVGSAAAPADPPASPRGDLGGADREGGALKSSCASTLPTGGCHRREC